MGFRGKHRVERAQYKVVGRAQVPGVGGRRRVRQQVRRAAGGPGSAVHARRQRPDIARPATGPQEEAARRHRRADEETLCSRKYWRLPGRDGSCKIAERVLVDNFIKKITHNYVSRVFVVGRCAVLSEAAILKHLQYDVHFKNDNCRLVFKLNNIKKYFKYSCVFIKHTHNNHVCIN